MKVIVWEDGYSDAVKIFYPCLSAKRKDESEDEFYQRMVVKLGVSATVIDVDDIPKERATRDGWKLDGGSVKLDRDRAIRKRANRLLEKATDKKLQLVASVLANDTSENRKKLKDHKDITDQLYSNPYPVFDGVATESIMFYEPKEF